MICEPISVADPSRSASGNVISRASPSKSRTNGSAAGVAAPDAEGDGDGVVVSACAVPAAPTSRTPSAVTDSAHRLIAAPAP